MPAAARAALAGGGRQRRRQELHDGVGRQRKGPAGAGQPARLVEAALGAAAAGHGAGRDGVRLLARALPELLAGGVQLGPGQLRCIGARLRRQHHRHPARDGAADAGGHTRPAGLRGDADRGGRLALGGAAREWQRHDVGPRPQRAARARRAQQRADAAGRARAGDERRAGDQARPPLLGRNRLPGRPVDVGPGLQGPARARPRARPHRCARADGQRQAGGRRLPAARIRLRALARAAPQRVDPGVGRQRAGPAGPRPRRQDARRAARHQVALRGGHHPDLRGVPPLGGAAPQRLAHLLGAERGRPGGHRPHEQHLPANRTAHLPTRPRRG